jgi:pyridoxamine 5'-phosphate oxidase family protein
MSNFTALELEYLVGQKLGRIATVGADGTPHVVPVTFRHNPATDTIDIAGHNLGTSKKFRDIRRGSRVAVVIDDVLPPWNPRGIEVRGTATALDQGGRDIDEQFDAELIRVTPERIIGWGLDTDAYQPNARSVPAGD